jgi:hypothetical protein
MKRRRGLSWLRRRIEHERAARDRHDDRIGELFGLPQEDPMSRAKKTDDAAAAMSLQEIVQTVQEQKHQTWPLAFTWVISQANLAVDRWGERMKLELRAVIDPLLEQSRAITVSDADSMERADSAVRALKEGCDVVEVKVGPFIETFNKLHKFGTGVRTFVTQGVLAEQDRLRREMGAQKRRDDEARREQERQESLRRQREDAERLNQEAELRRAQGDEQGAAVAEQQAATAPAPAVVLPSSTPELRGTHFTTYHRWRPIGGDTPENRKRLAMTIVPREHLMLDDKSLDGYAERMKGLGKIPGIEFYSEELPTQRRRSA